MINALPGGPGALHGGSGGAQQQHGAALGTAEFRHVPCVIPGRIFRLVAALLLLVHDNDAQILQRGKHGGPGSQHHVHLSPADALPLVVPLRQAQSAVEHHHPGAEIGGELPHHLGRQHDLRHQDDGPPSLAQHLLHQTDIDLRLAGAGDALEQHRRRSFLLRQRPDATERRLLLRIQHDGRPHRHGLRLRDPQLLLLGERHEARLFQRLQGPEGGAGKIAQVPDSYPARGGQQPQDLAADGGGPLLPLRLVQGVLGVHSQLRHPAELVVDLPAGLRLQDQHFFPAQCP